MGAQVKRENKDILDTYKVLGVGQILNRKLNVDKVSSSDIEKEFGYSLPLGKIQKAITSIKGWFGDHGIFGDEMNESFEVRSRSGTKFKELPKNVKEDFLGSFLWQLRIEDLSHTTNLTSLFNRSSEDEDIYTVVTKISMAKNDIWKIKIKLNEEEYVFKPDKVLLRGAEWYVEGVKEENGIKDNRAIEIAAIKRIEILS